MATSYRFLWDRTPEQWQRLPKWDGLTQDEMHALSLLELVSAAKRGGMDAQRLLEVADDLLARPATPKRRRAAKV